MLLIVNADDFGYTPGVNRGVAAAIRCGIVKSVSILANQPGTAEALAALHRQEFTGVSAGVHLCVTKGRPLSLPELVPSLVDAGGDFKARQAFLSSPLVVEELQREFFAQVDRVKAAGVAPTHLDTHHHVHAHPVVLAALISVARACCLAVRHLDPGMRDRLRTEAIPTPDRFCGDWFAAQATPEAFRKFVAEARRRGTRSLELMTHPGEVDGDLRRLSGYTTEREKELAILCSPALKQWLQESGVRLGSYADLLTALHCKH
ncbi:MAG: ChbG/HpnK family deacetylase [Bacillota bacterium]|jgi:predicted glycoside hydrolase/deacetylase ChbG (UPF0249 family)|nr:ChbG/HpnK family deacetylase [Thermoanaerobacteraceae bacterium]